jgi:hypothetical protein
MTEAHRPDRSEPTADFGGGLGPSGVTATAAEAMTPLGNGIRELAERTSNGTLIRLVWREETRDLWVEVWEPELDVTIKIPADPDRALEAFHHPYAYAAAHDVRPLAA